MEEKQAGRRIYNVDMTPPVLAQAGNLSTSDFSGLDATTVHEGNVGNAFAAMKDDVSQKSFSDRKRPGMTKKLTQLNFEDHLALPMPKPLHAPELGSSVDCSFQPHKSTDTIRKSSDNLRRLRKRSPTMPSLHNGSGFEDNGEKKVSRMDMLKSKLSFKDLRKEVIKAEEIPPLPVETAYTRSLRANLDCSPVVLPGISGPQTTYSLRASSSNTPMGSPTTSNPATCQSLRANLSSPLASPSFSNPPTIEALRASSNGTVVVSPCVSCPQEIHVEKRRPSELNIESPSYTESFSSMGSRIHAPHSVKSPQARYPSANDKLMDKNDPSTPSTTDSNSFSTRSYSPVKKHVFIPNSTLEFREPKSKKRHDGKQPTSPCFDITVKTPQFPGWFKDSEDYMSSFKERLEKAGLTERPTAADAQAEPVSEQLVNIVDMMGSIQRQCDTSVANIGKKADDLADWVRDQLRYHMKTIEDLNRTNTDLLKKQCQMTVEMMKSQLNLRMEMELMETRIGTLKRRTLDDFDDQITSMNQKCAELSKKVGIVTEKFERININHFAEELQEQRAVNAQIQEDVSQLKNFLEEERLMPMFQTLILGPTQSASSTASSPLLRPLTTQRVVSDDIQALTDANEVPEAPGKLQRSGTMKKGFLRELRGMTSSETVLPPVLRKTDVQNDSSSKGSISSSQKPIIARTVISSPNTTPKDNKKPVEIPRTNEETKRWNPFGFHRRQDQANEAPSAASSHNGMIKFLRSSARHAAGLDKSAQPSENTASDSRAATLSVLSIPEIYRSGYNPAYNTAAHPATQTQYANQSDTYSALQSPPVLRSSPSLQIRDSAQVRSSPYSTQNEIRSVASFDGQSHTMRESQRNNSDISLGSPLSPSGNSPMSSSLLLPYYHENQSASSGTNTGTHLALCPDNHSGFHDTHSGKLNNPYDWSKDDWSEHEQPFASEAAPIGRQKNKFVDDWVALTENSNKSPEINEKEWCNKNRKRY
ncbi:hypothetical protein N7495_006407 [Penicillium taxi]|uniref:uncharacterized protein n=1 Tax=Penicillium taxi TaxID=168475 RepID=UPI002545613B|nr:uncharacterized protein N7495_006407 [Penicillium taxi]KAJ5894716.1 hypothetical protein N7495_006407 [Penicillium taxi]